MSFDLDLYSDTFPGAGNVATSDGTLRSVVFIASLGAPVAHSAITWLVEESADGGTTWTTADPSNVLDRKPADLTITQSAFHVGYVGKQGKARASLSGGGTPAYSILYGNIASGPVYSSGLVGIDA